MELKLIKKIKNPFCIKVALKILMLLHVFIVDLKIYFKKDAIFY